MRTWLAAIAVATVCIACQGVTVNYVDAGNDAAADTGQDAQGDAQEDGGEDSAPADAGGLHVVDGQAVGSNGACGCDTKAGFGCCIPAGGGAAFCSDTAQACVAAGGMFVGCETDDSVNESVCCWNGAVGATGYTALSGACGSRPHACLSAGDCAQSACEIATCGGVTIGACKAKPACP